MRGSQGVLRLWFVVGLGVVLDIGTYFARSGSRRAGYA